MRELEGDEKEAQFQASLETRTQPLFNRVDVFRQAIWLTKPFGVALSQSEKSILRHLTI